MMLTEKEARKKWCPFARVTDTGCATNRHAGRKKRPDGKVSILRSNAMCIASECMAWRTGLLECFEDMDDLGYCGIAGKPEGCCT